MSHNHAHGHSHGDLLGELAEELGPVLEYSEQGVYIYMDDDNKVCNEKFAMLLGYGSADEWAKVEGSFPVLFVDEKSQDALIEAFQKGMEHMTASTSSIVWKKKSGGTVDTTVILVPISFKGHLFALHYVA